MLRTNTGLSPLQAMLRYKQLAVVEQVFRTTKSLLATRPIYHRCDATIRGHVFCSFLALVLREALEDRLAAREVKAEWADIVADLDRLQEVEIDHQGKRLLLRTPTTGVCGKVFQAAGVALPPSLPSVPTSRASCVTSPAKAFSMSTMPLTVVFTPNISP